MTEIQKLQHENKILKKQLEYAQKWMLKEIKSQIHQISKRKLGKISMTDRDAFLFENIEEIISQRVIRYFGELLLLNAPKGFVEAIITAEINFYHLQKKPSMDGFTVVSSYHKAFDALIERCVTQNFRKFAKKQGMTKLTQNDPLEKALHLVVSKGYILSVGRLYALLKRYREEEIEFDFEKIFENYVKKYPDIRNIFENDNFYENFIKINASEILGSKRHKGTISFTETQMAREILLGNFENKESLLYILLASQSVDF